MALRSVLEIDVDDSAFQQFQQTFDKYQRAVQKLPAAWKDMQTTQQASKSVFADMAAALMAQAELLYKARREAEGLERASSGTSRSMSGLARHTKEVAGNLAHAAATLVKWTGATALASGLLGGGGLWGIDRLARSAGDIRRDYLGLSNTGPTEQQGFGSFGRVVDPRQFLSQMTEFIQTSEGKTSLGVLGIGQSQWGSGAANVGVEFLRRLQRVSQNTPDTMLGPVLQGMGIGQFRELATRLKNLEPGELEQLGQRAGKQQAALQGIGLTGGVLKQWQDFTTTVDQAGEKIRATFIVGLVPLAKPLEDLSEAFSDLVAHLLKWAKDSGVVDNMAAAIKKFASYIGTPEFDTDVKTFVSGIGTMAAAIKAFVEWFAETDIGKKAGIVAGAAGGMMVGGPVGAVIGAGAAAAATSDAGRTNFGYAPGGATNDEVAFVAAYREWEKNSGAGTDKRSKEEFIRDYKASHSAPSRGGRGGPMSAIKTPGVQGSVGTGSYGKLGSIAMPQGADPGMWEAFKYVSQSEGATDNPWNFVYRRNPAKAEITRHTASGYSQMLRSNWAKYGDSKYKDAIDAPAEVQFQAFSRMYSAEGIRPWSTGAGGPFTPPKIDELHRRMKNAIQGSGSSSVMPPFNSAAGAAYRSGSDQISLPQNVQVNAPAGLQVDVHHQTGANSTISVNQVAR